MGIRKGVSRKKLYNVDKFVTLPLVNVNVLKELFYSELLAFCINCFISSYSFVSGYILNNSS